MIEIGYSKGRMVPDTYVLRESVFEYTSSLTFETSFLIPDTVLTLYNGVGEYPIEVVRVDQTGFGKFTYLAYPVSYMNLQRSVSPPLYGQMTLAEAAASVGIPYSGTQSTQSVMWFIPSSKAQRLMDALMFGALVKDGGCGTLHYAMDGVCYFYDLRSLSYEAVGGQVSGELRSRETSVEFTPRYPGIVDFYFYSPDYPLGDVQTEVFAEGMGRGSVRQYLSSDSHRDMVIRRTRNEFWRALFNNSRLLIDNALGANIVVGSSCKWLDLGMNVAVLDATLKGDGSSMDTLTVSVSQLV